MRQREPIRLRSQPRPPERATPRRFPVVAAIAPIVVSAVLFAVTRSTFTLVFALLGPVVAVASSVDGALHARRAARTENARYSAELAAARAEIDDAHRSETTELVREFPAADFLAGRPQNWGDVDPHQALPIRLGLGSVSSSLALGSIATATDDSRLAELATDAAWLRDAPVTADLHGGVAFAGPHVSATAAARAVILQLAARLDPDTTRIEAPDSGEWEWLDRLPHSVERTGRSRVVRFRQADRAFGVTVASQRVDLARDARTIVEVGHGGEASTDAREASATAFRCDLVSAEAAAQIAAELRRSSTQLGLGSAASGLPDRVGFADLPTVQPTTGLAGCFAVAPDGPLVIDLVADGPHAIVGGTTGSGKSELLVSWVLSMAASRSPAEVAFLFVDFKGGAAFDPLLRLPHSVGVITDLDADHALRALESLGAELRYRERVLAGLGLRALDEAPGAPPFPRLVVVVDEYASLVETHTGLHAQFTDLAARGRSLGVHLILCTQRPSGVVRDAILANAPLRLSLRVMTAADSTAVIGTDAAARLPVRPRGRALVSVAGEPPRLVQVAVSSTADCEGIAARWSTQARPRSPWLPPLPAKIRMADAGALEVADDLPFAVADVPEEQSQPVVRYHPTTHGSLLVVGAAGSGKSTVLSAMAASPSTLVAERLPTRLPELWDALMAAGESVRSRVESSVAARARILLLDDLDAIVARCDEQYRTALLDLVSGLLRDGPGAGYHLVVTMQRVTGALQSIASLCGSLLLLRMPGKQEHVLAGGSAAEFSETLPTGGGYWRGHRIQVFDAERVEARIATLRAVEPKLRREGLVAVSTHPERLAERIRAAAPGRNVVLLGPSRMDAVRHSAEPVDVDDVPEILVGDPETWQSQWALLASRLRAVDVLLDGCSLAEVRTITRSRELPPPVPRGQRPLWIHRPGGELLRAVLPEP